MRQCRKHVMLHENNGVSSGPTRTAECKSMRQQTRVSAGYNSNKLDIVAQYYIKAGIKRTY